ncbi:NADH-quinone oxidoreductase subunit NuoN [[Mycobacterium] wendilense]|uniref:NADH-quinone oxidoreductase subunit N n=1 Tax=[Mycobacterium] wendilense TaxID=3064284 RepID=A0ABM9MGC2_9MYCO|nr:NADH-quinone oxidoreductase subunit NuoN [Mycolicibacterium sp. MU0050]CAJ1584526.1 NADH-quinone oxidoreductase subunit NuoN [Mycolicibacterium sp. MU0050]
MTTLLALDVPSVEYAQLSPMLIVVGVAVAGVLVEAFFPRGMRYRTQLVLSLGGLTAALVAVVLLLRDLVGGPGNSAMVGSVAIDAPALFLQATVLVIAVLGVLLIAERHVPPPENDGNPGGLDGFTPQAAAVPGSVAEKEATRAGSMQTEVFPITMFAVTGMLLFGASDDLLTMFVALEVLSLPLYLLCGLARHRRLLSQEAALKYFLLGAFSSAFFLYGIALLYGYSGTFELAGIAEAVAEPTGRSSTMALIGLGLVAVGLLFKVGAVPFHSWIPDVYQGAPTPITAFMAAATKVAAFGAMLRVFYVAVPGLASGWRPMMWAVAIVTMVIGTVVAVRQTNVKRLLAYSAISHAGFILTGVIALTDSGISSTLFYLFAYGFSTLGAFAVVGLVRDRTGAEDSDMVRWAGLGRRYPLVGVVFSLFLLAFAGIPLTSGFVSKFAVFKAAGEGGAMPLVVVGVVASAIAAYFYVRVIVWMFFTDPPADAPVVVAPSWTGKATVAVTAGVTVVLGALPQPLLDLANNSTQFLR